MRRRNAGGAGKAAQQRGEQVSLGGESTYGNFAEGDEGSQNGMMEDSTRTARIRKPLESYYFSIIVKSIDNQSLLSLLAKLKSSFTEMM